MERETMGDVMASLNRSGWVTLGKLLLGAIYIVGIVYTGLHNWSLFQRTFPPELRTLAWVTLIVTEGGALALPIVAHYMAAPGFQRLWAWILYAGDFLFIAANTILDGALNRGAEIPEWLGVYAYFVPAVPVAILAGIAVYWAADPGHRLRDVLEQARVASIEALARRIQHAAMGEDVNDVIDQTARALAHRVAEQISFAPSRFSANGHVQPDGEGTPKGGGSARGAGGR
jgi:hypothetical protein